MGKKKHINLTESERELLELLKGRGSNERVRDRSHAILLNSKGYSITMLADIFSVKRDTISSWIKRWEREKGEGLLDKKKSGRPRYFTEEEEKK